MTRTLFVWSFVALALGPWAVVSAGSGKLPDASFRKLASSHASAEDHVKLAAHYNAHAAEHEQDARFHRELAAGYETSAPKLVTETLHYAEHSRESAEALRSLAAIHLQLAKEHGTK